MNPHLPILTIGIIVLLITLLGFFQIQNQSSAQSICENHIYKLVELFCKSHGFAHGNLITHECINDTASLNFTVGCDANGLYAKLGDGEWECPMLTMFT